MKIYPNILQSFAIVGIMILCFLIFSPVYFISSKTIRYELSWLIYYLLAVGASFVIISLIKKKKTGNILFNTTIENKRIVPFVIIGTIFLYCGIVSPITAAIPISANMKESLFHSASIPGIFSFLQSVIAAPILEELIFSGIILDGLIRKYSPFKSILATSFLFGLIHLNPSQFVVGFIMGFFTGWIYYKTRSISYSILIHSIYNLVSILMRYFIFSSSIMDNILLEMYGGVRNLIFVIVGSFIIIAICIYSLIQEFNKKG